MTFRRRLRVERSGALPRLGWLAEIPRDGGDVAVRTGEWVESADGWLVEGVWDGSFEDGGFHESEAFFGSGLRLAGDRVVVSASTALVDRILYCELEDRTLVSNSLVVLLAATGARLDYEFDYFEPFQASRRGVFGQPRALRVLHPECDQLQQLFHGNLVIAGDERSIELRSTRRAIGSYEEYLALLQGALAGIGENLRSPRRRIPLTPYAAVSSGYDSAAVACLTKPLGVAECFTTSPRHATWRPLEDGAAVAAALGLEAHLLEPPAALASRDEAYFLVPTIAGSELAMLGMTRFLGSRGAGSVLFSGHCPAVVWELGVRPGDARGDLERPTDDGLGLAEVRLASGFVHAAVPFLFARNVEDLRRISASEPMARWRLGTPYDRPIPRRILESAGVPRTLFGQSKRAVWEQEYEQPFDPSLRGEFVEWLDLRMPWAAVRLRIYRFLTALDRWIIRNSLKLFRRRWWLRVPFAIQRLPLSGHDSRQLMCKWASEALADQQARAVEAERADFEKASA